MNKSSIFPRAISVCPAVLLAALLAVGVVVSGCGKPPHELTPVSGKVTYNGKPLPFGCVTFQPETGQWSKGIIQSDGTFTMVTPGEGDGAAVGINKVRISCFENQNPANKKADSTGMGIVLGRPLIPKKYSSQRKQRVDGGSKTGRQRTDHLRLERLAVMNMLRFRLSVVRGIIVFLTALLSAGLASHASLAADAKHTFFPNSTTIYMPRGAACLLKPYLLPAGKSGKDYRLLIDVPDFLRFVTIERSVGNPPREVLLSPGQTRDGVKYVRHELIYDQYPAKIEDSAKTQAQPQPVNYKDYIAALLFATKDDAPQGTYRVWTQASAPQGPVGDALESELVVLPQLKNVRPKQVQITPCLYGPKYEKEVSDAYAENLWRCGCTWTYGNVKNSIVPILLPRGHRIWLSKPGEPF